MDIEINKSILKRFLNGINKEKCWDWCGDVAKHGYGRICIKSKKRYAHRVSYEIFNGKILDNSLVVDHLCRNKKCVNPKHLELVTTKINVNRGISPCARNGQKKFCKWGHPFNKENTRLTKNGRKCVICTRRLILEATHFRRYGVRDHILRAKSRANTKYDP